MHLGITILHQVMRKKFQNRIEWCFLKKVGLKFPNVIGNQSWRKQYQQLLQLSITKTLTWFQKKPASYHFPVFLLSHLKALVPFNYGSYPGFWCLISFSCLIQSHSKKIRFSVFNFSSTNLVFLGWLCILLPWSSYFQHERLCLKKTKNQRLLIFFIRLFIFSVLISWKPKCFVIKIKNSSSWSIYTNINGEHVFNTKMKLWKASS